MIDVHNNLIYTYHNNSYNAAHKKAGNKVKKENY
jgi:hypothetical protein